MSKKGDSPELVKGRGRCPKCGSRKVAKVDQPVTEFYAETIEVCGNCSAAWEPMPPGGTHLDDDGTPFPFPEACNNCAFRPGSPEQQDPVKWKALMESLKAGGAFHCHKGVPINPEHEHGFEYPKGGKDPRKLRTCRGYLDMTVNRRLKEIG